MRFAVVGSGISGLVVAHLLHRGHDITVFEANAYPGGHTNTIRVDTPNETHQVDTGFTVFTDRNYPNFERLLEDLTPHYVETLRRWRRRFTAHVDRLAELGYDERFRRLWTLYLAYCEAGFAERRICDVQLLLATPRARITSLASRDRLAQNQRRGLPLSA